MKHQRAPIKPAIEQQRLNALAENLDALARMVRHYANANERSEPVYAGCVQNRLPDAARALAELQAEFGAQNAGDVVRGDNGQPAPIPAAMPDAAYYAVYSLGAVDSDVADKLAQAALEAAGVGELVAALDKILSKANHQQADGGDKMDFQDTLRQCGDIARAALAKAKGGGE